MDLDVRCKATLIGACFLIDYMFFEKKTNLHLGMIFYLNFPNEF